MSKSSQRELRLTSTSITARKKFGPTSQSCMIRHAANLVQSRGNQLPKMHNIFRGENFKLRNRLRHFSKLRCKRCDETTSSHLWDCECGERWTKCLMHQHFPRKYVARKPRKRTWQDEFGGDAPITKRRNMNLGYSAIESTTSAAKRIRLTPGSKLAAKFPHLMG